MKKNHYVDNRKFNKEVTEYTTKVNNALSKGKEVPDIPDYITECILKMVYSIASRPNFSGYSYIEDMIGDGIEYSVLCLKRGSFMPDKGSAFSYFSTVIWNSFLKRKILEEEEQMVHRNLILNTEFDRVIGNVHSNTNFYGKYRDYVERTQPISNYFEEKNERIKKNRQTQNKTETKQIKKRRRRKKREVYSITGNNKKEENV